jgi:hypothetical protein
VATYRIDAASTERRHVILKPRNASVGPEQGSITLVLIGGAHSIVSSPRKPMVSEAEACVLYELIGCCRIVEVQ